MIEKHKQLKRELFGDDFTWGVAGSAYQYEGAAFQNGKSASIWDTFSSMKGKIHDKATAAIACDFYNRYESDIQLLSKLNISNFRYSISWSRILPEGIGRINQKGVDFYNALIDSLLEYNIKPWFTLYHWDLPQVLQDRGGWTNREIVNWFNEYAFVCANKFGDRVKNWMVLNEPMAIAGAGYFLGVHAPGKRGIQNFLPAAHHTVLCQSTAAKTLKQNISNAKVGTTFSCSYITPHTNTLKDLLAAHRVDTLLNRMFVEPALGLGYPSKELPMLKRIEKYMQQNDEQLMHHDFDFIGLQNYTREVVKHSYLTPYINAALIPAQKRKVECTAMNWEIHPNAIYKMLKQFSEYENIPEIIVTENGAAFNDTLINNKVYDDRRIIYLEDHLHEVLKAKQEGVNVKGYLVWSFLDNFEWTEGYRPRFGLVYVDFNTQKRIVKNSGKWFADFLQTKEQPIRINSKIASL